MQHDDNYDRNETGRQLNEVLSMLMEECDVNDAALAKHTGIPKATIGRMRRDPTANPTASTLSAIAKFFGVSISQLIGDDPLSSDRLPGSYHPEGFTSSRMPVLKWEWAVPWTKEKRSDFQSSLTDWISTEKTVGENAFALVVPTDSLGLIFRKGSLLIIDPDRRPKDHDFILMQLSGVIVVRQLLIDGPDIYIKSVNPEMKETRPIENLNDCLGVITETRTSWNEDLVSTASAKKPRMLPAVGRLLWQKAK